MSVLTDFERGLAGLEIPAIKTRDSASSPANKSAQVPRGLTRDGQAATLSADGTQYVGSERADLIQRRAPLHESRASNGLPPPRRLAGFRKTATAGPDIHEDADELANVYLILANRGELPLGAWAIPGNTVLHGKLEPNLNSRLLSALAILHGELSSTRTETDYLRAYSNVVLKLRETALKEANLTLVGQIKELKSLDTRLSQDGMADRLHGIADGVRRRAGGFVASGEDVQHAQAIHGLPGPEYDARYSELIDENFRIRVENALAAELLALPATGAPNARREARDLCKILSLHPQIIKILDYYSQSAKLGDRLVHALTAEAMAATAEFNAKLTTEPDHVWRYPPLIALSIKKLGLQNIPGFPEYAVDIGMVMSRSWSDSLLSAAGLAIFAVGILLTGPLAVGGLALDTALAGVALTDLAVTGTSGYLTYLRESEQDIAAVGGGFRPDRIAKRSNFSGSILAGSAALICGIAFVFSGAKLIKAWRVRAVGTPPPTNTGAKAARQRPSQQESIGTENKALRRGTDQRARFQDRVQGPYAGPKKSIPTRNQPNEVKAVRAGGTRTGSATESPTTTPQLTGSKGIDSKGPLAIEKLPGTVHQYLDNLIKRFPRLSEAKMTPIARNTGEPGLWEESVYTGSGKYSWSARLRDGRPVQLDDIDRFGIVVDTKFRGIDVGREIAPPRHLDVVDEISGSKSARIFDPFPEKMQNGLLRQLRFSNENQLNGVRWETNSTELKIAVEQYARTILRDDERRIFTITMVQR